MPKHLSEEASVNRRDAIIAGLKAGKTLFAISQEMRLNAGSVYWIVKKYGLDPKTGTVQIRKHNILTDEEHARRRDKMAALLAKGLSAKEVADKVGMAYGTVHHFLKKYGLSGKVKRPTTTSGRLAVRKHVYQYGGIEKWQVADPNQFPDDIITEAVRMIGCDRQHAAWVLSCPWGGNAHGWRGGAAIG